MNSQVLGSVLAATITAVAALVVASMARRTTYHRRQLKSMSDEAELLALLPEGHSMRSELERVLEVRLKGYARLFDHTLDYLPDPMVPAKISLCGLLVVAGLMIADPWLGISDFIGAVFKGEFDWSADELSTRQALGMIGANFVIMGVAMSVFGIIAVPQWWRVRKWRRSMNGDELYPTWLMDAAAERSLRKREIREMRERRARLNKKPRQKG